MATYEDVHSDHYLTIKKAEWVADPFVPEFYLSIQNNIGPDFGGGINFIVCEQGLRILTMSSKLNNPLIPIFCVMF